MLKTILLDSILNTQNGRYAIKLFRPFELTFTHTHLNAKTGFEYFYATYILCTFKSRKYGAPHAPTRTRTVSEFPAGAFLVSEADAAHWSGCPSLFRAHTCTPPAWAANMHARTPRANTRYTPFTYTSYLCLSNALSEIRPIQRGLRFCRIFEAGFCSGPIQPRYSAPSLKCLIGREV